VIHAVLRHKEMMNEKHIAIRRKPFLISWLLLFLISCSAAIAYLRSAPIGEGARPLMYAILSTLSIMLSLALAFVTCGITEAIRKTKAGELTKRDYLRSFIIALALLLVFIVDLYLEGAITSIALITCVVLWIATVLRRMITTRKSAEQTDAPYSQEAAHPENR
jgi:F0F1-type ATP synthase membrane subunit a